MEPCDTWTALQALEAYKHHTEHLRSTYTQIAKEALTVNSVLWQKYNRCLHY